VNTGLNAVSVAVLGRRLESITDEMGSVLTRTTSSPLFQARDCGVGLADAAGRVLCQAEYMPLMSYAWVYQLKALTEFFGDDIHPGDCFTSSDVFYGGNQAQDVAVFTPIFVDDRLRFWSIAKGHVIDIGGPVLSGYNPDATEVWQETIRITPIKLHDRGVLRADVWNFLLENTRVPEIAGRDWQAMVGACEIGRRRLSELVERYGEDELLEMIDALMDSTEQRMRYEIEALPDGVYQGEASWHWVSESSDETYIAHAEVTISGSDMRVDFSGTDPQSRWYLNGAYSTTFASAIATLFMLVDPDIPHNDGALRGFTLDVPEGTFLNAAFPAPTVLGNFVCNDVVPEAIMRALAPVTSRVTAGWCRPYCHVVVGVDPRTGAFNVTEPLIQNKGGAGATDGVDGYSTIGILTGGGAYLFEDYESFEIQNPVFLLRHEYETDSAGPGHYRGGLGLRLEYLTNAQDARVVTFGDGHTVPYGLAGGGDAPSSSIVVHDNGQELVPVTNGLLPVAPGARIVLAATGGGGYGDPRSRPLDLVVRDVQNGVVSVRAARQQYGVVFRDGAGLEVDMEASAPR
jgi:N-methylhydantoinase B